MKKCPFCAEEIQDEAVVCRWCHKDLPKDVECRPVPKKLSVGKKVVLWIIFFFLVIFILKSIGHAKIEEEKEAKSAGVRNFNKAPAHKISEGKDVKPAFHIRPILEATDKTIKLELIKQFGTGADVHYEEDGAWMGWNAVTTSLRVSVTTCKGKVAFVIVKFTPPVKDRATALALADLTPANKPPTTDPVMGPRWEKLFERIDEVQAFYEPMGGPQVKQLSITPDLALAKLWDNGAD